MDTLLDLLDDIDRLHADRRIDIRHRERFNRHLDAMWPTISAEVRRKLDYHGEIVISHIGTLEHCRKILEAYLDDFRMSNRGGLTIRLDRAPRGDAYRLSVTARQPDPA